jgi:hypothetical protein
VADEIVRHLKEYNWDGEGGNRTGMDLIQRD